MHSAFEVLGGDTYAPSIQHAQTLRHPRTPVAAGWGAAHAVLSQAPRFHLIGVSEYPAARMSPAPRLHLVGASGVPGNWGVPGTQISPSWGV